uniref:Uncharacterized protein n=1 Tax=Knipowitschia caucasica TaxID=637954 RepID=A0AAV2LD57_KNICA
MVVLPRGGAVDLSYGVAQSSTPFTSPQQPDTGDERSRQACKRGVPSRPACLSVCPNGAPEPGGKITHRDTYKLTPD